MGANEASLYVRRVSPKTSFSRPQWCAFIKCFCPKNAPVTVTELFCLDLPWGAYSQQQSWPDSLQLLHLRTHHGGNAGSPAQGFCWLMTELSRRAGTRLFCSSTESAQQATLSQERPTGLAETSLELCRSPLPSSSPLLKALSLPTPAPSPLSSPGISPINLLHS